MRIKLLMLMIIPLLLLECQTSILTMLTRKDSNLYTNTEKIMLGEISASVDFRFGYDPDLEMDYVFKAGSFSDKEIAAKSPDMKKVLLKYDLKDIIPLYEKIVQMKESQVWKMDFARNKKDWVTATYIQKYTLPEAEQFLNILEKNVLQIDTEYAKNIEDRKNSIKNSVAYNLLKELQDKERKMREQRKPAWK